MGVWAEIMTDSHCHCGFVVAVLDWNVAGAGLQGGEKLDTAPVLVGINRWREAMFDHLWAMLCPQKNNM